MPVLSPRGRMPARRISRFHDASRNPSHATEDRGLPEVLYRADCGRSDHVGLRLDLDGAVARRRWPGDVRRVLHQPRAGLSRPGGRGDPRRGLRDADALLLARFHQSRPRRPKAGRRSRGRADRRGASAGRAADGLPRALRPALSRGQPQQGLEWVVEGINRVLPVAREHDIVLGLENHYKDSFWSYPEFAQKMDVFLEVLAAIPDRDHFGVQYDPSNAIVAGDDPIELLRRRRSRRQHARQRSVPGRGTTLDDLRQNDGTLGYSPNLRHGVTGKGLNDYDAIFRILAEQGYRGWISIEDGMNGMDEMAESLAFLRRMAARYFPD